MKYVFISLTSYSPSSSNDLLIIYEHYIYSLETVMGKEKSENAGLHSNTQIFLGVSSVLFSLIHLGQFMHHVNT